MSPRRPFSFLLIVFLLIPLACQIPALPRTQATPTVPASGAALFQDDFSNPSTHWERQQTPAGAMDYDAGGYRIVVNQPNTNLWSTPHKDFADVRLEADEGKLGGADENRAGLICRYTAAGYYFFMITHDGFYGIGMFKDGQTVLLGHNEMQSSAAIHTGVNTNHLRADCVGDTLTFYVNGEQIAQTHDSTLTHGDVGLIAGTFSQPNADFFFDDFVVIQP